MQEDILAQPVDKSQIPPLHQKRILAFVNHFLINSCSFLNDFALKCESKLIEIERSIQKVEAALTIVEAKLASIPDAEVNVTKVEPNKSYTEVGAVAPREEQEEISNSASVVATEPEPAEPEPEPSGVRVCDDVRYKKFFKMVQFGVPAEAVKLKMQAEGIQPNLLDTPNALLPDGVTS